MRMQGLQGDYSSVKERRANYLAILDAAPLMVMSKVDSSTGDFKTHVVPRPVWLLYDNGPLVKRVLRSVNATEPRSLPQSGKQRNW